MKVGDTVKLKPAMWQGIKPEAYGLSFTGEYVVEQYIDIRYSSIKLKDYNLLFDASHFQVVVKEKEKQVSVHKYKIGDVLCCVSDLACWYKIGEKYKVRKLAFDSDYGLAYNVEAYGHNNTYALEDDGVWVLEKDFELVEAQPIERPVLEERKKDKIRMELVDQGFPLALLELAKVMTWANNNKGYKDHDWKNIPDAENAFKGAAARHRVKFDAQRSFGNEMLDCTDEESGIIHLAHECFNILALLELALAGKVK